MTVNWHLAGPCRSRDPEEWFTDNPSLSRARTLCRGCPILRACAEYALRLDVQGVWGGTTHRQRRTIQRQRGITPTPITEAGRSRPRPAPRALALLAASEELMQSGLSLAEAAERLDVTFGLLKAARARARRNLADLNPETASSTST